MDRLQSRTEAPDVVIAGGGMAGLTLALALHQGGLDCVVIESQPYETQLEAGYDGRASAIAYGCFRQWEALGVAEALRPYACRMDEIMVTDGHSPGAATLPPSPFFLNFAASEIAGRRVDPKAGDEPSEPLGYMVENRQTRRVLHEAVRARDIALIVPAKIADFTDGAYGVEIRLEDGRTLKAPVLVACEGRGSTVRMAAGLRKIGWDYGQSALVCTLKMQRPHRNIAYEYFLSPGPFAILPLNDNRACIVWSESHARARALKDMDAALFLELLKRRVGDFAGEVSVEGDRFVYPLSLSLAEDMVSGRVALLGDAAHGIHPIAGQGLNLGLKDVAALAEVLIEAMRHGEDIGSPLVLERYGRWRRFDNVATSVVMDGFVHLFSNNNPLLRLVRDVGMGLVDRAGPLRRLVMQEAGADLGALPRLLQGAPV